MFLRLRRFRIIIPYNEQFAVDFALINRQYRDSRGYLAMYR